MVAKKGKSTGTDKNPGSSKKKKITSKIRQKPKQTPAGKAAKNTRRKSTQKAGSGKRAPKKSSAGQSLLSNEIKKIVTAIIILVSLVAAGAMVADLYFGRHPDKMREVAGVQKKAQDHAAVDDEIADLKFKKPMESLKPKSKNKKLPIAGGDTGGTSSMEHDLPGMLPGDQKFNPWKQDKRLTEDTGIVQGDTRTDKRAAVVQKKRNMDTPLYELFHNAHDLEKSPREPIKEIHSGYPRVAIIIDDIGFDKKLAYDLLALDSNFTFSILPCAPFSRIIAENLHAMGAEIMLHLPMEPVQYPEVNPGPGAILASMSPDVLLENLRKDLDSIPHAKGVNNHMGSRITSLSPQMRQIFTVLKQRDLFFIDSLTSSNSLCRQSARLFHLPFAQRDVFLDNIQEETYIRKQLMQLVRVALDHGTALGIGHPYKATLDTLKKEIPGIRKRVRLVPASTLVVVP